MYEVVVDLPARLYREGHGSSGPMKGVLPLSTATVTGAVQCIGIEHKHKVKSENPL
jgi:hypothetical protein